MDIERRLMPRFTVNLTVSSVNHQAQFGRIKDFSRTGMKVILDMPVLIDQSDIQIAIQRPDYNEQILATVAVVWKRFFESKCEVGLSFKSIPVQAKADFLDCSYKEWLKNKLYH